MPGRPDHCEGRSCFALHDRFGRARRARRCVERNDVRIRGAVRVGIEPAAALDGESLDTPHLVLGVDEQWQCATPRRSVEPRQRSEVVLCGDAVENRVHTIGSFRVSRACVRRLVVVADECERDGHTCATSARTCSIRARNPRAALCSAFRRGRDAPAHRDDRAASAGIEAGADGFLERATLGSDPGEQQGRVGCRPPDRRQLPRGWLHQPRSRPLRPGPTRGRAPRSGRSPACPMQAARRAGRRRRGCCSGRPAARLDPRAPGMACTESLPSSGLTVTQSAPSTSKSARAYAWAVLPMSPRLASRMRMRSPGIRARRRSRIAYPADPSCSKNARFGLKAQTCSMVCVDDLEAAVLGLRGAREPVWIESAAEQRTGCIDARVQACGEGHGATRPPSTCSAGSLPGRRAASTASRFDPCTSTRSSDRREPSCHRGSPRRDGRSVSPLRRSRNGLSPPSVLRYCHGSAPNRQPEPVPDSPAAGAAPAATGVARSLM